MTTDRMHVGGERIDGLVGEMTRSHAAMGRTLDELQASLDLLSTQWSGEARRAYARAQQQWSASMQQLHDELDRTRRNTQISNDTFTQAARTTQRIWSE